MSRWHRSRNVLLAPRSCHISKKSRHCPTKVQNQVVIFFSKQTKKRPQRLKIFMAALFLTFFFLFHLSRSFKNVGISFRALRGHRASPVVRAGTSTFRRSGAAAVRRSGTRATL